MKFTNRSSTKYDDEFYHRQIKGSIRSAHIVVPYVLELCKVNSAIDFGCGTGSWLAVFQENGVKDYLGIDGHYTNLRRLVIPKDRFEAHDLTIKIDAKRRFDLAICLEVAEHLEEKYSDVLIDSICGFSDLVLFSAAPPHQGGTDHVNEQWPDYWVEKFRKRNYHVFDVVRRKMWSNPDVECWYAQNLLLFANDNGVKKNEILREKVFNESIHNLNMVHPTKYLQDVDPRNISVRRALRYLSIALRRKLFGRVN